MSRRRSVVGPETLFELFDLGSPDDTAWMLLARCGETDPEAFFPEASNLPAKRVCAGCPVRAECLAYAVANDLRSGVWGGLPEGERRPLHVQARAAAVEGLVA